MKVTIWRLWKLVGLILFLLVPSTALRAQTITVTSANPNNAPQGSVNLNVLINGKGFKKGAISKFFVSGTTDPGGVTVNSTTFVSSGQLSANINVASNATPTQFDIVVMLTNGSSGKGTKLFAVTVPDPAIAFQAGYNNRSDLVVMNADGTSQNTILSQQHIGYNHPVWSPDGSRLAFTLFDVFANHSAIYIVNKDGSGLTKVIDKNYTNSYAFKIGWSPVPLADGQYKIAFSDEARLPDGTLNPNDDIFIVNLNGSGLTRLTSSTTVRHWDVSWSPTADRIAVVSYDTVLNQSHLYLYSVQLGTGGFTATLLTDLVNVPGGVNPGNVGRPDWARTQDDLAVSDNSPTSFDIWKFSILSPGSPIDLTSEIAGTDISPSWSPDDSQIVFAEAAGNGGIWVMNSDGSGVKEIVPSGTYVVSDLDWRRCGPTGAIACAP